MTVKDYPLMEKRRDEIRTPGGHLIDEVTLDAIETGRIGAEDCRISKTSLLAQAEIAESAGDIHIAENFRRAAELVDVDNEKILAIYNALRPYRSTAEELLEIARELETEYGAVKMAAFVREALTALEKSGKLKRT